MRSIYRDTIYDYLMVYWMAVRYHPIFRRRSVPHHSPTDADTQAMFPTCKVCGERYNKLGPNGGSGYYEHSKTLRHIKAVRS